MKKILLILIIGMFLINQISAEATIDLGTIKQNECATLYQSCPTCTYSDIRTIRYPNGTSDSTMDITMNKNNSDFYYSFCNTSQLGEYSYIVYGNKGGLGYESSEEGIFEVTPNGEEINLSKIILSSVIIFILIGLFIINIFTIPKIPNNNDYEEGVLISINNLKYLRPILYVTAYLILMSIVFISSNMSFAYLGINLFSNLLYKIFYIMMALTTPMLIFWFIFIFYNIFQDRKLNEYLERGLLN